MGLVDLLEGVLGARIPVHVGVIPARHRLVGTLDLLPGRVPRNAQHVVVVAFVCRCHSLEASPLHPGRRFAAHPPAKANWAHNSSIDGRWRSSTARWHSPPVSAN